MKDIALYYYRNGGFEFPEEVFLTEDKLIIQFPEEDGLTLMQKEYQVFDIDLPALNTSDGPIVLLPNEIAGSDEAEDWAIRHIEASSIFGNPKIEERSDYFILWAGMLNGPGTIRSKGSITFEPQYGATNPISFESINTAQRTLTTFGGQEYIYTIRLKGESIDDVKDRLMQKKKITGMIDFVR